MSSPTEVAYYYPAPYWGPNESPSIKSMLLFFDEVSILLPSYMHGRHRYVDPSMVIPLEERGLLRVLDPTSWITAEMVATLSETMHRLLDDGMFDHLPPAPFQELSASRLGYHADVGLADSLVTELQARGLARPTEDGVSMPLHPVVRSTVLVLLGQLARIVSAGSNLVMHPVTNEPFVVEDLLRVLSREALPSAHGIVALDLEPVAFDLDPVPLDDVLDFRASNGAAHKAYMRDLRRFVGELSAVADPSERKRALLERRQELADAAHALQRSSRTTLGKNLTSVSLGIAGAAWSASTGDPIGVVLGAAGLLAPPAIGALRRAPTTPLVAAYSYIFAAQRQFSRG